MSLTSIFLVLFFSIIPIWCDGQTLIPQAGVSFSKNSLKSSSTDPYHTDVDLKVGMSAGVGVVFPDSKKISFQSGIFYTQKGYSSQHTAHENGFEYNIHFDARLDYLEVPVQARIRLKDFHGSSLYLKGGASVSYSIGGRSDSFASYGDPNGLPLLGSAPGKVKYSGKRSDPVDPNFYMDQRTALGFSVGYRFCRYEKNKH
jgi:hypothetical protein